MKQDKRFSLVVAKIEWPFPKQIIAVQVPWDQFCAIGVPGQYAAIIARTDAIAVIVSKSPDGKWASSTAIEDVWGKICKSIPVEAHRWHTMLVEADRYPWELS
jgi:hypothetical protein